jgi:hypothetical protein
MRLRPSVVARYAGYVLMIVGWLVAFNALSSRSSLGATVLVVLTVALYWFRRWRIPHLITRTETSASIAKTGKPVVVEFYSDL